MCWSADPRSFELPCHFSIVITQLSKWFSTEEVELCCPHEPVHSVAFQICPKNVQDTGHMGELFCWIGLLKEKDWIPSVSSRVGLSVGITVNQTFLCCKCKVTKQAKTKALWIGLVHRTSGILEHVLVQSTVLWAWEQKMGVVLVSPNNPGGHVFVFLEGGERDERPAHVPHVDVVVHHHGTGGEVMLSLRPPLYPGNWGDCLNTIDLLCFVSSHVPNLHHLVSASCSQPAPSTNKKFKKTQVCGIISTEIK